MSKLLKDALADAKALKSTQYALAKAQLEETFQPTIQRVVSARLSEEESEEEDDFSFEDQPEENPLAGEESGFESFEDDTEEEVPMEGCDSDEDELAELMRELDGEEDEFEEPMMEEDDMFADEEVPMEESDEVTDDEIMEYLLHEEDEFEDDPVVPTTENRRLRTENKKLSKNLRETLLTVASLKSTLNEVNLLNSKLLFNTRINRQYELSKAQKSRVLEALDRAKNVREAKLVYATICEGLNKSTILSKRKNIKEGTRNVPVIKPKNTNDDFTQMRNRMKVLANIN